MHIQEARSTRKSHLLKRDGLRGGGGGVERNLMAELRQDLGSRLSCPVSIRSSSCVARPARDWCFSPRNVHPTSRRQINAVRVGGIGRFTVGGHSQGVALASSTTLANMSEPPAVVKRRTETLAHTDFLRVRVRVVPRRQSGRHY